MLLILGSAASLSSCRDRHAESYNPETLVTQRSDTLTMIVSKNGIRESRFTAPLMENYELAREPYMVYRKGIYVETYKPGTEEIESTIIADYAIRYEGREVWEARGNVVATGHDDRTLYTEQLFWNQKTGRIYSNVESTVVQGDDVFVGEGFESDEKFEHWTFRNYTGRLAVDVSPNEGGAAPGEDEDDADAPGVTDNRRQSTPAPTPAADNTARSSATVTKKQQFDEREAASTASKPAPVPRPSRRPGRERDADDLNDNQIMMMPLNMEAVRASFPESRDEENK